MMKKMEIIGKNLNQSKVIVIVSDKDLGNKRNTDITRPRGVCFVTSEQTQKRI
jgi:hypothetical protein